MANKGSLNCKDIDNDPLDVFYLVLNSDVVAAVSLYFFF